MLKSKFDDDDSWYYAAPFNIPIEYTFSSNNVSLNANFNILGTTGSRNVHVVNNECKLIKVGLLHVTTFRSVGVINAEYKFEVIKNNINLNAPEQIITIPGDPNDVKISTTVDVRSLNIIFVPGDSIGLRFISGRTGDYMEVRLTLDLEVDY